MNSTITDYVSCNSYYWIQISQKPIAHGVTREIIEISIIMEGYKPDSVQIEFAVAIYLGLLLLIISSDLPAYKASKTIMHAYMVLLLAGFT